jgi:hypothetical protein
LWGVSIAAEVRAFLIAMTADVDSDEAQKDAASPASTHLGFG